MEIYDCDKFESCSAPVCPLWRPIQNQKILRDEKSCFYLLEYQKRDSKDTFDGSGRIELYDLMARVTHEIYRWPNLNPQLYRAIQKASKTGSRILAGRSLNA